MAKHYNSNKKITINTRSNVAEETNKNHDDNKKIIALQNKPLMTPEEYQDELKKRAYYEKIAMICRVEEVNGSLAVTRIVFNPNYKLMTSANDGHNAKPQ